MRKPKAFCDMTGIKREPSVFAITTWLYVHVDLPEMLGMQLQASCKAASVHAVCRQPFAVTHEDGSMS